jgi:polyisoprenoid-binding protein YceI
MNSNSTLDEIALDTEPLVAPSATHSAWQIDPAASRVEFKIGKRLLFVKRLVVTGRFSDVSGTIMLDEQDPTTAQASVTIGAASINTRQARRDKHLRNADFFDVEKHPTLTFRSLRVDALDKPAGRYRVVGNLTVRDVTREVTLDAHYSQAQGASSDRRLLLNLTAPLKRLDFGLTWSKPAIKIDEDLTVTLSIEAARG